MAQRRSGYDRADNDLYRTPPAPIDTLAACSDWLRTMGVPLCDERPIS